MYHFNINYESIESHQITKQYIQFCEFCQRAILIGKSSHIHSFYLMYDRSDTLGNFRLNLFVLGKAAFFELGEREVAVDGDLKTSAAGGNEREAIDVLLEFSQKPVRQTDGLVFVASSRAVFDVDSGHTAPP